MHLQNPVTDIAHHAQIVGDENGRKPETSLEVVDQVKYLCLNAHVEGRHRFVEHYKIRIERQRAGDDDALSLAAGKLMRVAVVVFRPQFFFLF